MGRRGSGAPAAVRDRRQLEQALEAGLVETGLQLTDQACRQLIDYLQLLERWGRAYNLTAVRDPLEMVPRHLLDSLSILPLISGRSLADVGAGAGLPGIPLAIVDPERHFEEIDSNGKRCLFMEQVVSELRLTNVTVRQARLDGRWRGERFDGVVSRALATLECIIGWVDPLLASGGRLYAMKGVRPVDELTALPAGWRVTAEHRLSVPGVDGERCLIELMREGEVDG